MLDKIKHIIPAAIHLEVSQIIARYDLKPLELAHLLAQCDHESGGFKHTVENLNYTAQNLMRIFPKYFKTVNPNDFAHKPEAIANRVYANRLGNGNELTGDGWRYRGRGFIQITGRANYQRFFKSIGLDEFTEPEVLAHYPLSSAAWFFDDNQLWKWCLVGSNKDAVVGVTKRVNAGLIGLDNRVECFNKYWALLKP
jgi:putative chitinase